MAAEGIRWRELVLISEKVQSQVCGRQALYKAIKERRRWQKEQAASQSSPAQAFTRPKYSWVCTSRIGLYSHQWACKNWPLTFPNLCEESAIIIIFFRILWQSLQSSQKKNQQQPIMGESSTTLSQQANKSGYMYVISWRLFSHLQKINLLNQFVLPVSLVGSQ